MSDDRLLHRRCGRSEKVNRLTPEEELVWITYIQAADDFGVMLFDAIPIQHIRTRFAQRARKTVMRMLEVVAGVDLVRLFTHQTQTYCYQHDWQKYQKVRYPHKTDQPKIPDWLLATCDRETQYLHTVWPGGERDKKLPTWKPPATWQPPAYEPEPEQNRSETVAQSIPALALARTQPVPVAAPRNRGAAQADEDRTLGTGAFVRRFCELYKQHCGATYHVNPSKHIPLIRRLLQTHGAGELERLTIVMLTATADAWLNETDRGIEILHTKINWLASRLAAYEREHGRIVVAS